MQLLNITKLPIYLPYDTAPIPFGDPLSGVTYTAATPSIFTVKGYKPNYGDAVQLSVTGSAALDTNFAVGTRYYVTSITTAAGTFALTTAVNGGPITAYAAGTVTSATAGNTIHLVSNQVDGTVQPFKSGDTVIAVNLTTATVYLEGAPDLNTTTYGNPQGPGTAAILAAIPTLSMAQVVLQNDWLLTTSAGPGSLALIQN